MCPQMARRLEDEAVEAVEARQSPRGERLPPEVTFGPFGSADRLN